MESDREIMLNRSQRSACRAGPQPSRPLKMRSDQCAWHDAQTSARMGRPSKVAPFRSFVIALLCEEPDIFSSEILLLAQEAGYTGGKTAMYDLVASLRDGSTTTAEAAPDAASATDEADAPRPSAGSPPKPEAEATG